MYAALPAPAGNEHHTHYYAFVFISSAIVLGINPSLTSAVANDMIDRDVNLAQESAHYYQNEGMAKTEADSLEDLARQWGLPHVPLIACALPGEESLRQRLAVGWAGYQRHDNKCGR